MIHKLCSYLQTKYSTRSKKRSSVLLWSLWCQRLFETELLIVAWNWSKHLMRIYNRVSHSLGNLSYRFVDKISFTDMFLMRVLHAVFALGLAAGILSNQDTNALYLSRPLLSYSFTGQSQRLSRRETILLELRATSGVKVRKMKRKRSEGAGWGSL